MKPVYKIVDANLWKVAEACGTFTGSDADKRDGFIHLSTAAQLERTARTHFRGLDDLLLIAVDATHLGNALKYEASRSGDRFPHLYATLPMAAVRSVRPLPLDAEGNPVLPNGLD
ncbi:MAG: hypothetical protein AMXMBFR59_11290 [Rhodanobacteraceae bacterium]